jgi:hypothetical protein
LTYTDLLIRLQSLERALQAARAETAALRLARDAALQAAAVGVSVRPERSERDE